jgi:hypothetical protein
MRERMLFRRATFCLSALALLLAGNLSLSGTARSQDAAEQRPVARAAVAIEFLPPPLESATYSLGIYDLKTGKLIRHLHEIAPESAFTVGTNGLVTSWDGKDDAGQKAPPGRYAARGYAVGPMKVEGTQILGNDWASDDETLRVTRVEAIAYLPPDGGVGVLATMADGSMALLSLSADGKMLWRQALPGLTADAHPRLMVRDQRIFVMPKAVGDGAEVKSAGTYKIKDGVSDPSSTLGEKVFKVPMDRELDGRSAPLPGVVSTTLTDPALTIRSGVGTSSVVRAPAHLAVSPPDARHVSKTGPPAWSTGMEGLRQIAPDGTVLRKLEVAPGDPIPVDVSASDDGSRLYLLEQKKGWQRLRGLSWVETKEEDGQPVSTWQTFFERNIRAPDPAPGLENPSASVQISLAPNPLEPGKLQTVSLAAAFDDKGSYLTTADGLRLRQISQQPNLRSAKLEKSKDANGLTFFQSDTAAWDEFSIEGAKNMMAFDAGEFELTATGEKPVTEKAPEPDL